MHMIRYAYVVLDYKKSENLLSPNLIEAFVFLYSMLFVWENITQIYWVNMTWLRRTSRLFLSRNCELVWLCASMYLGYPLLC